MSVFANLSWVEMKCRDPDGHPAWVERDEEERSSRIPSQRQRPNAMVESRNTS